MRKLRCAFGYTLGELVIVMVITAVVAAVLVPVASEILNEYRLAAIARQVGFEAVRARMQAVGQNRFVRLTLVGTTQYKREYSEDGTTYTQDEGTISLPSGFTVLPGSTGTPRFDRQGVAQGATQILVYGPNGQKTVNVSVLGRVTIG